MITMSKFYELLRGHAHIRLTDRKGSTVYFDGVLNALPDRFDNWTIIDFDTKSDLAGELTYRFLVKE